MPSMQNFAVNQLVLRLFQAQGLSPDIDPAQKAEYLRQLQQQQLRVVQQYRQMQQNNPNTLQINNPAAQEEEQRKNENRLVNMASMARLLLQQQTMAELMNEYQQHEHKSHGKEHGIKGDNNDGSLDDEFSADIDGDGNVTAFERERFENFLVTKVEEIKPGYAQEYKVAQDEGTLMEGAAAGAEELMQKVVEQSVSAVNEAVSLDAEPGKKPSSPFSNPFSMKPTPPTSTG